MPRRSRTAIAVFSAAAALLAAGSTPVGADAARRHAGQLYVSPHGSDRARCTRSHPCRTISRAVQVARAGEEIHVRAGSYSGQVTVTKRLTIKGLHNPILDVAGQGRGILIRGHAAAGTVVEGLDVEGAKYEGILALRTSGVVISNNIVRHDDRGFFTHHYTGECAYNGQPPGARTADLRAGGCGEAIHLASTSHSRVIGNFVTDNTGGIYLTDESGPAAHNLIARNEVVGNLYDCGITLASHSRDTVTRRGRVRPHAGGVYDNTIIDNVADKNGVRKAGAGILVAAAFAGGAAYDNRIIANMARGNGLPGIALHSHDTRQDLNGNIIRGNIIGRNAIGGRKGGPGDGDGGVSRTVGILVWSWGTKLRGIQIAGNHLSDDYFGVWTQNVPRIRRSANSYRHVRVPLKQR